MPGLFEKLSNAKIKTSELNANAFEHEIKPGFFVDRPSEKSGLLLELLGYGGALPGTSTANNSASKQNDTLIPWWLSDPPRVQPNLDLLVPTAFNLLLTDLPNLHTSPDDLPTRARKAVSAAAAALPNKNTSGREVREGLKEVISLASGMGPLTALFEDKMVTDIFIDDWDRIRCLRKGRSIDTPFKFRSLDQLKTFLSIIAKRNNAPEDASLFVTKLPFVSRIYRSSAKSNRVEIRIPRLQNPGMYDLLRSQLLPAPCAAWLSNIVSLEEHSILVVGARGSGKTTLLSGLLSSVGTDERVVSIERVAEIKSGAVNNESFLMPSGKDVTHARLLIDEAFRAIHHRIVIDDLNELPEGYTIRALETGGRASFVSRTGSCGVSAFHALIDELCQQTQMTRAEASLRISALFSLILVLDCIDGIPCLMEVLEIAGTSLVPLVKYRGEMSGKRRWELLEEDTALLRTLRDQGAELGESLTLVRQSSATSDG